MQTQAQVQAHPQVRAPAQVTMGWHRHVQGQAQTRAQAQAQAQVRTQVQAQTNAQKQAVTGMDTGTGQLK